MKLKNKQKKFSFDFTIITVVKNDEDNIENTIKSVLSQKKVKIQYIVLDGFSKDKTSSKIKKYKKLIKFIRYKDKSFYDGLNHSLKFAKGKYVGILNSGDIYFNSNTLNKVKINSKKSDFLFGNVLFYNNDFKIVRNWDLSFAKNKKIFFYYIAHSSLFISLNIMKNYLKTYNLRYKISSDTDLLIRLNLHKKIKYKKIKDYLVFMKIGGLSTNPKLIFKKILEDMIILKSYFKYSFIIYYIKKVLIKLNGYFDIKKKWILKKQLINTLNNLNDR